MVKYLTYKRKKLPIRVSYFVMLKIQEKYEKSAEELMQKNDLSIYQDMLFFALESGYKAIEQANPWKPEDMIDILDECFLEFVSLIPSFFQKGMGTVGTKAKMKTMNKK